MPLRPSKGNMYDWLTHTWNPVKGICYHGCIYCYMANFNLKPVRLERREFKEFIRDEKKYGEGLFIFVGSSVDLFAEDIPAEWINEVLDFCQSKNHRYLFQSKNPQRMASFFITRFIDAVVCTTIETNRVYKNIMNNCPPPQARANGMCLFPQLDRYVTIEPILDFDVEPMVELIRQCDPKQVNIGADSKGHKMPEPSMFKVKELISELESFTTVKIKGNLSRLGAF